ncbi:MAG TPA: hypothetical protein VGO57_11710 [Verrucomicrobiae bacterium]|jgi:hypothetical protein
MKIKLIPQSRAKAFVLVMIMIICAVSLLILAGTMYRAMTVSRLNQRSNQLFLCRNMAEAATEKVYARMAYDFLAFGSGQVSNNLSIYRTNIPSAADNSYFTNFVYSDGTSNGCTYVSFLTNYTGQMPTQYSNSYVSTSPIYRIMSNVSMTNSLAGSVVGTAQEDVLLALVPITTYAVFYNGELEFSDCATMTISGRTHANGDICSGAGSGATLTFNGAVTCCSVIQSPKRGGISYSFNQGTSYKAGSSTNVTSVQISIPMANTHAIIEMPPSTELPTSVLGQQRLFNQAQVILIITNSPDGGANPAVYLTLQNSYNGTVPGNDPSKLGITLTNVTPAMLLTNANNYYGNGNGSNSIALPFLSLVSTFTDQREKQTNMLVAQIDVSAYDDWTTTNPIVTGKISSASSLYPTILYVADQRAVGTSKLAVVRLVNGQQLPSNNGLGFTVATQNPIYVEGNYNTTQDGIHFVTKVGQTTNGWSVPAALIADAITVLSPNWADSNSKKAYTSSKATSMTMDAAIVVGNIPSTGTDANTFSGGVQNLTRLLEDWSGSGVTLTYNTSIVCLFSSQMATHQFQMPQVYYEPPTRNWGFDPTYYSPNKQPPGVPSALVPIRFNWTLPSPNTVSGN